MAVAAAVDLDVDLDPAAASRHEFGRVRQQVVEHLHDTGAIGDEGRQVGLDAAGFLILQPGGQRRAPLDLLAGRGLAQVDAPPGTFLAYATAPGNVAADGDANAVNGLYTQYLLEELKKPTAKIEDVFKRVRFNVRQKSEGRQIPWESTSLEDDFYFNRGVVVQAAAKSIVANAPTTRVMRTYGYRGRGVARPGAAARRMHASPARQIPYRAGDKAGVLRRPVCDGGGGADPPL